MGKTRKRGGSRRKRGGFAGVHDAINTLSANIHKGINVTDAELRKAKENLKKTVTTATNQAHSLVGKGRETAAGLMAQAQGALGTTAARRRTRRRVRRRKRRTHRRRRRR